MRHTDRVPRSGSSVVKVRLCRVPRYCVCATCCNNVLHCAHTVYVFCVAAAIHNISTPVQMCNGDRALWETKFHSLLLPSAAGLSQRRPVFDLRSVHMGFVVDNVTLGELFLPVLLLPTVGTTPLTLHTHLQL